MQLFLIGIALVIGCASAVQGATNGSLAGRIGLGPTVLINSIVVLAGAVCLALALAPARAGAGASPAAGWSGAPWFLYVGGLYGLTIIAGAAFAFPRLGAGPTTALMLAAQLATALVLDHLGWPSGKIALTPMRLVGALLLVVGALLVLWPKLAAKG